MIEYNISVLLVFHFESISQKFMLICKTLLISKIKKENTQLTPFNPKILSGY